MPVRTPADGWDESSSAPPRAPLVGRAAGVRFEHLPAEAVAAAKLVTEHDLRPADVVEIVDRVHPNDTRVPALKSPCREYLLAVAAARRGIPDDAILVDYRRAERVKALVERLAELPDVAELVALLAGPD
jgi:hypothetical protein